MKKHLLVILLMLLMASTAACNSNMEALPAGETVPQRFAVRPAAIDSGLAALQSYRTHLTVEFEGTRAGQRTAGQIESVAKIDRSRSTSHHILDVTGNLPNAKLSPGTVELLRIDNSVYLDKNGQTYRFEEAARSGERLAPGDLGLFELEKLIVLPNQVAAAPAFETVDGRRLQKFSFTEQDLISPDTLFEQAQGQVWVDAGTGLVIRYEISATVRTKVPIANAHLLDTGRLELSYRLAGINETLDIPQPLGIVAGPLAALPRLSGSQITTALPALLAYTAATTPLSATLFYRDQLTALNWTEEQAAIFAEKASMVYSNQNGDRLELTITPVTGAAGAGTASTEATSTNILLSIEQAQSN